MVSVVAKEVVEISKRSAEIAKKLEKAREKLTISKDVKEIGKGIEKTKKIETINKMKHIEKTRRQVDHLRDDD